MLGHNACTSLSIVKYLYFSSIKGQKLNKLLRFSYCCTYFYEGNFIITTLKSPCNLSCMLTVKNPTTLTMAHGNKKMVDFGRHTNERPVPSKRWSSRPLLYTFISLILFLLVTCYLKTRQRR